LKVIVEEGMIENSAKMGEYFQEQLAEIPSPYIKEVRGKGLLVGMELKISAGGARQFCEAMATNGVLAKETHEHVIRFAPPLIVTQEILDWAIPIIREVLNK
jgi:ornithine--oxo-acid transaminase